MKNRCFPKSWPTAGAGLPLALRKTFPYNVLMNWLLKLYVTLRLRVESFFKKTVFEASSVSGPLCSRDGKTRLPFLAGANLPWLRYGNDFGANAWYPNGGISRPEERHELLVLFEHLREKGISTLRWFLFGDGRAGIRFTRSGTPAGPDRFLFADIDTALETATACGLKIIFVLFDFHWFGKALLINGVQVRGRGGVIRGTAKQRALRRRVLRPLLERYGRSPVILAWDIVNEPEWATRGCGGGISGNAVSFFAMRRFIKRTSRLVHRCTDQLATVGLGSASGLSLVRDCDLDFYQVHWYDRWQAAAPLERPVADLKLDRPLLLGEFPTKNSARPAEEIVSAAKKSGYCGALAWSLLGTDRSSAVDLGKLHSPG